MTTTLSLGLEIIMNTFEEDLADQYREQTGEVPPNYYDIVGLSLENGRLHIEVST